MAAFEFEISTHNNKIFIRNKLKNYMSIEDIIPTCKQAWEFNDNDIIKISEDLYHIKYDIKIINNYLSNIILYFPNIKNKENSK